MSQALYDAMNGMSPEELWARYRQYPWLNKQGKLVMQGEPKQYRGPGFPNNTKTMPLGDIVNGGTSMIPPRNDKYIGTLINSELDKSSQLKILNHEKQHEYQLDNNLPTGPVMDTKTKKSILDAMVEYINSLGEAQARMSGNRSAMPDAYKDMVHPYSQTYQTESPDLRKHNIEQRLPPDKSALLERLRAQFAKYGDLRMLDAQQNMSEQMANRGMTIEDLLDQLRKMYIPPFISPGLQQ